MQATRISLDISVMWREQYTTGAGYIRQLAVKGLTNAYDKSSPYAAVLTEKHKLYICMRNMSLA